MYKNLPYVDVPLQGNVCWEGWDSIYFELARALHAISKIKKVVAIECYHGTLEHINFAEIKQRLTPNGSCKTSHLFKEPAYLNDLVSSRINDEHQQPKFTGLKIDDYFDPSKLQGIQESLDAIEEGVILLYGPGAAKVCEPDLLIYADMSQWEIQQRLRRRDISNLGLDNENAPYQEKYAIAFFNDWQICNHLKIDLLWRCDYFLETNNWVKPKLAAGNFVRKGLKQATTEPLKLAPFFDPTLWNRQPIQDDASDKPYQYPEWCFNCAPEEDNILFRFGEMLFETPLLNLIYYQAEAFLGTAVLQKFGRYLPIRFNFIDTSENSEPDFLLNPPHQDIEDSLGCHYFPSTAYYFLQVQADANLEYGEKITTNSFGDQAVIAEKGNFKEHDFIQIPNGVPFRPGPHITAVQIDTAPEIFSKKMAAHQLVFEAAHVVPRNIPLQSFGYQEEVICTDPQNAVTFIRNWFSDCIKHHTNGTVNILVLVAGQTAVVESPSGNFEPIIVHYGEPFIVPATVGSFQIRPLRQDGKIYATLKAVIEANPPQY
ncbi:MAG TPA: hypothetical protein PKA00_05125 [Saprospiraceae bacterium]|nr:hypothetical protein [Saprospiraceae bacterium]HMQ82264.1 hypothetical protein [Saprospiraceae bacterium]